MNGIQNLNIKLTMTYQILRRLDEVKDPEEKIRFPEEKYIWGTLLG